MLHSSVTVIVLPVPNKRLCYFCYNVQYHHKKRVVFVNMHGWIRHGLLTYAHTYKIVEQKNNQR